MELKIKSRQERTLNGWHMKIQIAEIRKLHEVSMLLCSPAICQLSLSTYRYSLFADMDVRSNSISLNNDDNEYVSLTIMSWIASSILTIERGIFLRSR